MSLVSECCGAHARGNSDDMGICPDCKEYCDYVDTNDEVEPDYDAPSKAERDATHAGYQKLK